MPQKFFIFCFLLLTTLSACDTDKKKVKKLSLKSVSEYVRQDSLSLQQKLQYLLAVDSIAVEDNNDSAHLELVKQIAETYYYLDNNYEAKKHFLLAADLANSLNNKKQLAVSLSNAGFMCDELSLIDSAIHYYSMSNDIFITIKDSFHLAQGLGNLAITYKKAGLYDSAIKQSLVATGIFKSLNKVEGEANALTTIGNCLVILERTREALRYHQKALELRVKIDDSVGIAGSLNNLGNVYRHNTNYEKALEYYLQALTINKRISDDVTIARTTDNIAELYFGQQEYDKASMYFEQALAIRERDADIDGYLTSTHRLCRLYLQTGEFSKAKPLAIKARSILEHSNFEKHKYDNALILSELYQKSGDYYEAYTHANSALSLKDSLFSTEMSEQVSRLETEFRTKEQEQQLLFADKLKKEQAHTINTQKFYIILLIVLLCFLIVISYLIYRLSKQRKKAKEKVELLMSELNHRVGNNLQVISSMLKLQIASVNDASSKLLLANAKNRVESMWVIHGLLHEQKYTGVVDIHSFIASLAKNLNTTFSESQEDVDFSIDVTNIRLATDIAIPLGLIINELLTNIFKHGKCSSEKFVHIQLARNAKDVYYLIISDNCLKWDVELMKVKESGLGLDLIDTLVSQIGGSWQVVSNVDGTVSTVKF